MCNNAHLHFSESVTLSQVPFRARRDRVGRRAAMERGQISSTSAESPTPPGRGRLNHLEGVQARCGAALTPTRRTRSPGVLRGGRVRRRAGVDSFGVALFRLSEPGGDAEEAVARPSGYAHKGLAATNARAIIPPTEIVVAARTTFRLEQWNRFANPESNAQSFGKLVTQADGTIYNYDGVASEVVNAQLRIERLVHA